MVRLVGLEPTTSGFVVRRSIQLSYKRVKINYLTNILAGELGFEPRIEVLETPGLPIAPIPL
jgi:hypothetical protein